MGIFGSKQQDNLQDGSSQLTEQVHPVNTDGVITNTPQQAAATPAQSIPATGNDAGNYIVVDPPTQASPSPSPSAVPVSAPPGDNAVQPNPTDTPVVETPSEESASIPIAEPQTVVQDFEQTAPEVTPLPLIPNTDPDPAPSGSSLPDDLNEIKKEALSELSPIVDHLDQAPEDKFNTTMMLLQTTDDKNLIKVAYASAKQITDEKVRARALLDIVNEINYFTQSKS